MAERINHKEIMSASLEQVQGGKKKLSQTTPEELLQAALIADLPSNTSQKTTKRAKERAAQWQERATAFASQNQELVDKLGAAQRKTVIQNLAAFLPSYERSRTGLASALIGKELNLSFINADGTINTRGLGEAARQNNDILLAQRAKVLEGYRLSSRSATLELAKQRLQAQPEQPLAPAIAEVTPIPQKTEVVPLRAAQSEKGSNRWRRPIAMGRVAVAGALLLTVATNSISGLVQNNEGFLAKSAFDRVAGVSIARADDPYKDLDKQKHPIQTPDVPNMKAPDKAAGDKDAHKGMPMPEQPADKKAPDKNVDQDAKAEVKIEEKVEVRKEIKEEFKADQPGEVEKKREVKEEVKKERKEEQKVEQPGEKERDREEIKEEFKKEEKIKEKIREEVPVEETPVVPTPQPTPVITPPAIEPTPEQTPIIVLPPIPTIEIPDIEQPKIEPTPTPEQVVTQPTPAPTPIQTAPVLPTPQPTPEHQAPQPTPAAPPPAPAPEPAVPTPVEGGPPTPTPEGDETPEEAAPEQQVEDGVPAEVQEEEAEVAAETFPPKAIEEAPVRVPAEPVPAFIAPPTAPERAALPPEIAKAVVLPKAGSELPIAQLFHFATLSATAGLLLRRASSIRKMFRRIK